MTNEEQFWLILIAAQWIYQFLLFAIPVVLIVLAFKLGVWVSHNKIKVERK